MPPRTKKAAPVKSLEVTLWDAADKMRGNLEAAEYKHVVLGLVFLKYVSDAFETRHKWLEDATAEASNADYYVPNVEKRIDIVEARDEYTSENVFWVPVEARWVYLQDRAKQPEIGTLIDGAMDLIERENTTLKGVLPKTYGRAEIDKRLLGELVDLIGTIGFTQVDHGADDVLGRVYEYFLGRFAAAEGRNAGEFYTPRSVVRVLVEMLEPYEGRVFDPCCGSGGMYVQSADFVAAHGGKRDNLSIYGQEFVATTWRLAKMNLALRGVDANLGDRADDAFHRDLFPDLRADFILANPPFNKDDWFSESLRDDPRWIFGLPPASNANFAWVQHFLYHLAPNGSAGFVLANGSLTTRTNGEDSIRRKLVVADVVDCVVALPEKLFYNTGIGVSLWFVAKNRANHLHRDRRGTVLFIDARELGRMESRRLRVFDVEDVDRIARTYHAWRSENSGLTYEDVPGFCRSATLEEIAHHDYLLSPSRYVGVIENNHDDEPVAVRVTRLTAQLMAEFDEAHQLEVEVRSRLERLIP